MTEPADHEADELHDLRCELELARLGEHAYSAEELAKMRRRVAELEARGVGAGLEALLAAEDPGRTMSIRPQPVKRQDLVDAVREALAITVEAFNTPSDDSIPTDIGVEIVAVAFREVLRELLDFETE